MAVGVTRKIKLHLKNIGNYNTVYSFNNNNNNQLSNIYGIKCIPNTGLIYSNTIIIIDCYIQSQTAITYEQLTLIVNIRGNNSAIIKFSGESIRPDFSCDTKIINFGSVPYNSERLESFVITNHSKMRASMIIDMNINGYNNNCFRPILINDNETIYHKLLIYNQIDCNNNKLEKIQSNTHTNTHHSNNNNNNNNNQLNQLSVMSDGQTNSQTNNHTQTNTQQSNNNNNNNNNQSNLWKITINGQSKMQLYLLFYPTLNTSTSTSTSTASCVIGNFNFKLPFTIMGLQHDKLLDIEINGEIINGKLNIINKLIDFNDKVVSSEMSVGLSYYQEIILKNYDTRNGQTD